MSKYAIGTMAVCPHCNVAVQFVSTKTIGVARVSVETELETVGIYVSQCPNCTRIVISLLAKLANTGVAEYLAWPRSTGRPPVPVEVPAHIAQDYDEAALVLQLSPKASAALSRRCLQAVIREAGKAKSGDLDKQIDEVSPTLPDYISSQLHAVRQIGNFAAHTQKSQTTGEILDVEPGEAEWNLDVLDELFDHYYVKPARQQHKKTILNQKLQEAGKPLLK